MTNRSLSPPTPEAPPRPLPLMSSAVQKRGKLVREIRGPKTKPMGVRGTLCHDIFCPVPFPVSPSDFHRSPENNRKLAIFLVFSQEKASAEMRGEFFRTKSWVNFVGDFLVDFFGPFSLEKIGGKNPPKNPRQNSHRNLGVSRPKSTLQGSCLDFFFQVFNSVSVFFFF